MQHEIFYLTWDGKLGITPPCEPGAKVGRVLDLGTGTGLWAIDFADLHPEAEVSLQFLRRRPLLERNDRKIANDHPSLRCWAWTFLLCSRQSMLIPHE